MNGRIVDSFSSVFFRVILPISTTSPFSRFTINSKGSYPSFSNTRMQEPSGPLMKKLPSTWELASRSPMDIFTRSRGLPRESRTFPMTFPGPIVVKENLLSWITLPARSVPYTATSYPAERSHSSSGEMITLFSISMNS